MANLRSPSEPQRTTDSGANFWVGLARGGDGGFSWVDGTPFDLEFWLDGEPNSNVMTTAS